MAYIGLKRWSRALSHMRRRAEDLVLMTIYVERILEFESIESSFQRVWEAAFLLNTMFNSH
jgi:hypothetical protein